MFLLMFLLMFLALSPARSFTSALELGVSVVDKESRDLVYPSAPMRPATRTKSLIVLATVLAGSGGGCFFGGREAPDIKSPDPSLKIPAIKSAVQRKDMSVVGALIKDLESDDPAVRFYAIQGLQRLTGETFGYEYYAEADQRTPALQQWQQWFSRSEESVARGGAPEPMRARTDPGASTQP
jgi:hypothetical protein